MSEPAARPHRPRLRVLQLSKFFPPVEGGIESTVATLCRGLRERQVEVDVLCSAMSARTVVDTLPDGTRVTRVASLGRLLSTSMAPAMPGALAKALHGHDLLHVHMPDPMAALAVWACRPRQRVVLHWHSDVVRQRGAMRLYAPLQRWLLQRADAIVATSAAYAEASAALATQRDKVHVIPIGIDPALGAPGDAAVHADVRARTAGVRVVFALGRMTYYKGFPVLVRAAAQLPADVRVVIGGDGPELAALRRQVAAAGLSERVWLTGRLSDAEVRAWHHRADVFCLPSVARSEAFGVAIVEAFAAGRPVVATALEGSGVPWVNLHGITGLNVPPGDAPALAGALCAILDNTSLRSRLGGAARQRFEQEFRAGTMAQRILQLYLALLPGVARPTNPCGP